MDLNTYLDSLEPTERRAFARRCGTKMSYLNLIRCGAKQPSPKLAKLFHKHSGGKIVLTSLRPDIWDAVQHVA